MSAAVATINVGIHEVPLPAYWRIVDLHAAGKPDAEIVRLVVDSMELLSPAGGGNVRAVREVVRGVIDNQRRIAAGEPAAARVGSLDRRNAGAGVRRSLRGVGRGGVSRLSEGEERSADSEATMLADTPSPLRAQRAPKVSLTPSKDPGTTTSAAQTQSTLSSPPVPKFITVRNLSSPRILSTASPSSSPSPSPSQPTPQTLQTALAAAILAEDTLAARATDLVATRARFTNHIARIDYEEAKRAEATVDREIHRTLRRRQVAERRSGA